jgi:ATP-binding protein involved in chromosome partitioning
MRKFRTYHEVDHSTESELLEQVLEQRRRLASRLSGVKEIVAVASGKGGVGKSAVTANLAALLASRGRRVGAVDADLNGPSLGRMLGVLRHSLEDRGDGVAPATGGPGVAVISMELLQAGDDTPLRWRGPGGDTFIWQSTMESMALREFLGDVAWGELDYLFIDVPPGTDKITRLLELLPAPPTALVVTTPSEASRSVVARSIRLLREAGVERMGLVANMSGYLCPGCEELHPLFHGDGARELARATGVPIWAEIPFDPSLAAETDGGRPRVLGDPHGLVGRAFAGLADEVAGGAPGEEEVP